jgi:hypothetical protein
LVVDCGGGTVVRLFLPLGSRAYPGTNFLKDLTTYKVKQVEPELIINEVCVGIGNRPSINCPHDDLWQKI